MSYILIVEDDKNTAEMLIRLLTNAGYAVKHFERGLPGAREARLNPPALILMDFNLPDVDGRTLVLSLKKIAVSGNRIPIVAVTARSGAAEQSIARSYGCDAFIAKPFDPQDLLNVVQRFVPLSTEPD
jgi:DNA-binding response OmpR family regulator